MTFRKSDELLQSQITQEVADRAAAVTTLTTAVAAKADNSSLATVAKTGSYNDLADLPNIPALVIAGIPSNPIVIASPTVLGTVMIGAGLAVDANGVVTTVSTPNIAGGLAGYVPYQSAAGTTAFSDGLTYDNTARSLQVGTGVDGYAVILGGNNSISQPDGVTSSLIIRSIAGNAVRIYTDAGVGGQRGGDIRLYGGNSDTGQGANIMLSPGSSGTEGLSGYIKANGAIGFMQQSLYFSGVVTLDFSKGTYFESVLSGNTIFQFNNPINSLYWIELTFRFAPNPSAYSLVWPTNVAWATGAAPVIPATGYTTISVISTDGGITYQGTVISNTALSNLSGTNTGDETTATIKSKLGITTLSGVNTGDQVIPTTLPASDVYAWAKAATKPTYTAAEVGALSSITSANVITALGYTPYNGTTNPNSYVPFASLASNLPYSATVTSIGTSAVGTAYTVSRGDHVHSLPNRLDIKTYTEARPTVAYAATIALDLSTGTCFDVTLTGNTTFSFTNIPNIANTMFSFTLIVRQDATGSRTATFPTNRPQGGTALSLTTTANKADIISWMTPDGGTTWFTAISKNY